MFMFILGVVLGAAFAPFWIKLWNMAVAKFKNATEKKD